MLQAVRPIFDYKQNTKDHAVKHTLLLIEDDPDSLELYIRHLSPSYDVLIADCYEKAQKSINAFQLAAIIVEPAGMDAWIWDFLTVLKSGKEASVTPIIFCTVLDQRKQGRTLGAVAYLTKPVYPQVLLEILRRVIAVNECLD